MIFNKILHIFLVFVFSKFPGELTCLGVILDHPYDNLQGRVQEFFKGGGGTPSTVLVLKYGYPVSEAEC